LFTAAQAAEKSWPSPSCVLSTFTAAQAAEKETVWLSTATIEFTAAQAAGKLPALHERCPLRRRAQRLFECLDQRHTRRARYASLLEQGSWLRTESTEDHAAAVPLE
jgi:hypothetical protein